MSWKPIHHAYCCWQTRIQKTPKKTYILYPNIFEIVPDCSLDDIRNILKISRKSKPFCVMLLTDIPSRVVWGPWYIYMMTSSNGNIFRVTGPLCGEFTGPGEFPTQRPVTQSFDVFFDLRLNKPLSKQPWGWWFETLSRSLWRHRNEAGVEQWS